jgi:transcriptional regulator with GAF, ATPase, and Fis domain
MQTLQARVEAVLQRVRPLLQADGGDILLVDVIGSKARVRLTGKCAGCPSAALGRSSRMRNIVEFVRVIAPGDSSVLITGESGTGKELIANLLHHTSTRRNRPFVPVSCAILSESLIESELFGHERGAFTNAVRDRPGRFEVADGGTLFLDDIDDVPLAMQVKLLRVLQNHTVERVGGVRQIPVDVRVLTGSKRDLRTLVKEGTFREDLFYRLNVIPIQLPALRDRAEDIPLLVEHFFERFFRARGKEPKPLSPAMMEAFMRYPWPGNVRELENTCERIAQTCICDAIVAGCVPATMLFHKAVAPPLPREVPPSPVTGSAETGAFVVDGSASLYDRLHALEIASIVWALRATGGNKSKAAALLNVKRSTLGDRIKKLDLEHVDVGDAGSS